MRDPVPAVDHRAPFDARRMNLVDQAFDALRARFHNHLAADVFAGIVVGEIYRIAPRVEAELDRLEGVTDDGCGEYIRRHVVVEAGAQRFECLVYEIHPSRIEGRTVIDSGDWIAHAAAR